MGRKNRGKRGGGGGGGGGGGHNKNKSAKKSTPGNTANPSQSQQQSQSQTQPQRPDMPDASAGWQEDAFAAARARTSSTNPMGGTGGGGRETRRSSDEPPSTAAAAAGVRASETYARRSSDYGACGGPRGRDDAARGRGGRGGSGGVSGRGGGVNTTDGRSSMRAIFNLGTTTRHDAIRHFHDNYNNANTNLDASNMKDASGSSYLDEGGNNDHPLDDSLTSGLDDDDDYSFRPTMHDSVNAASLGSDGSSGRARSDSGDDALMLEGVTLREEQEQRLGAYGTGSPGRRRSSDGRGTGTTSNTSGRKKSGGKCGSSGGSGKPITPVDALLRQNEAMIGDFHYSEFLDMGKSASQLAQEAAAVGVRSGGGGGGITGEARRSSSQPSVSRQSSDRSGSHRASQQQQQQHKSASMGSTSADPSPTQLQRSKSRRATVAGPTSMGDSQQRGDDDKKENWNDSMRSDDSSSRIRRTSYPPPTRRSYIDSEHEEYEYQLNDDGHDSGDLSSYRSATENEGDEGEGDGGGKMPRRFSGHSLASIRLLVPNMEDFSVSSAESHTNHQEATSSSPDDTAGSANNNRRQSNSMFTGRRRVDAGAGRRRYVPDINPRWQDSISSSAQQWDESDSSLTNRRSRSLSPRSRGRLVSDHGMASTNFVHGSDSNPRWNSSSGSEAQRISGLSSSGSGSRAGDSRYSGGVGAALQKRIRSAGLPGAWSFLPRAVRKGSKDDGKNLKSKSKSGSLRSSRAPSSRKRVPSDVEMCMPTIEKGSSEDLGQSADLLASRRRRVIMRYCAVLFFLGIVVVAIPIAFNLPGPIPPRTAEAIETRAKDLLDRIRSSVDGDGRDELGRPKAVSAAQKEAARRETLVHLFEDIESVRKRIPELLSNLIDVDDSANDIEKGMLTPFLWDADRSGSSVIEEVMADCLGLRVAGGIGGHPTIDEILHVEDHDLRLVNLDKRAYLNVDLKTTFGINRAQQLGLLTSGQADIVVSPKMLYTSTKLFDDQNQGRMICMFRDPVQREVENYQNLVDTTDPSITLSAREIVPLDEYVTNFGLQEDYMTRVLTGNENADAAASEEWLQMAKDIVRTKCLVGLHEYLGPSIARVEHYFGYSSIANAFPGVGSCVNEVKDREVANTSRIPKVENGDYAYNIISKRNKLDTELYAFAKAVFDEQGKTLFD